MKILCVFALLLAIGIGVLVYRIEQKEYPRVKNQVATIVSAPVQSTYAVLADFGHQDVWYKTNKHQDMLTPPPYDAIGSIRQMNGGESFFGTPVILWEKLLVLNPDNFSWSYTILDYNDTTRQYSPLHPFYNQRSYSSMWPITTHGNNACLVEWLMTQNAPFPEFILDIEHQFIFGPFYGDLNTYLEKLHPVPENNPIFTVKDIDDKSIHLTVRQGTVVATNQDLWKKAERFREKAINVVDERADLPRSYELVFNEFDHRSVRTFRNVGVSPVGKSARFKVFFTNSVYLSMFDTFTLPKTADVAVYVSQVEDAFSDYVKELTS